MRRGEPDCRGMASLLICAAIVVPDLAEVREAIEFSCHHSARLRVADLKQDRQWLRTLDHHAEGDRQPSRGTGIKRHTLLRDRLRQRPARTPPGGHRAHPAQRHHRCHVAHRHRAIRLVHQLDAQLERAAQLNRAPFPGHGDRRRARQRCRGDGLAGRTRWPALGVRLKMTAHISKQQAHDKRGESDADRRSRPASPRPARRMAAHLDDVGLIGSAGRSGQPGRNAPRTLAIARLAHFSTIGRDGIRSPGTSWRGASASAVLRCG